MDIEKVTENMNIAKAVLCNPNMVTPEMCIKIGQTISDAISLLKEQAERIRTLEHRLVERCSSDEWYGQDRPNYSVHHWKATKK